MTTVNVASNGGLIPQAARSAFLTALNEIGSRAADVRRCGEIRLYQIPSEHRFRLVMEMWRGCGRQPPRRQAAWVLFAVAVLLTIVQISTVLVLSAPYVTQSWPFFLAILSLSFPIANAVYERDVSRERALLRLTAALNDPQVVPCLLDGLTSLSASRDITAAEDIDLLRRRLSDLLPDFLAADLPPLTDAQQRTVRNELQAYSRRIADHSCVVTDWECEYLVTLLNALTPPARPAERDEAATILERLVYQPSLNVEINACLPEVITATRLRLGL